MDASAFLRKVRELAAESGNVYITPHARKRMVERWITLEEVMGVLRKGRVTEGPFLNTRQNWQATVTRFAAGQEVTVAAAIDGDVVIITVY